MTEAIQEATVRVLKVPDPEFLLMRLKGRKEALILSGAGHEKLVGERLLMVNEILKEDEPARAFAFVSFTQEPKTITGIGALGSRKDSVDPLMLREFGEREGPIYILKLKLERALPSPRTLSKVPPGRFSSPIEFNEVDIEVISRDERKLFGHAIILDEAFHLRDVHWVPVPSDGTCPSSHPSKLKFPGTDTLRCFTSSAARVVRARESVTPFKDLPLLDRERPWDSDEAKKRVRAWATTDDEIDFDKYAMAFLVVDGPKENLTSYKLPFADFVDGRLRAVPRGVFAAAGVLQGARGGADLPPGDLERSRSHLGRYYSKMDLRAPWEPKESLSEQVEKLTNERAKLREAREDNPNERCKFCAYFDEPTTCKIIEGPVAADQVCDWIFSRETEAGLYSIADKDWIAFGKGMIEKQPYQHIVRDVAITPAGPVVMIEDTAKPPHRFSLTKKFHVEHTSLEHHWTQEEVDALVEIGEKETVSESTSVKESRILDALVLKEPHGRMIWEGKKTMIVRDQPLDLASTVLIASRDRLFGIAELCQPITLSSLGFRLTSSQHQFSEQDRRDEWPGHNEFYAYRIKSFEKFSPPRKFNRKGNRESVLRDVPLPAHT